MFAETENPDLAEARAAREWCRTGVARVVREAAGLSRSDIARELGVSTNAIRMWENGDRRPRVEVASQYAALLRTLMIPPGAPGSVR